MKVGFRKTKFKEEFESSYYCQNGKDKLKKAIISGYGKKGSGWIKNPKKAAYNKVYQQN